MYSRAANMDRILVATATYYLHSKKSCLFKKSCSIWNHGFSFSSSTETTHRPKIWGACKGQMKSECIDEIIDFSKYHLKNLMDFCPERLFRLGMLCTLLSRVALRIIKTNYIYLVYKTFQGRNISNLFGGIFEIRLFHKYILILSDL